ncbi:MAG: hypothetical protein IPG56_08665 [Caulobacteraceae bacterium]|nr:hypothetical protein [Caulobacteraceae bacterium]
MTAKFEQRVLRDMMWGLRLAYGTRGGKRKPPDQIRVAIPTRQDESVIYTEMRHEDVAAKAVLPVFARMPAIVDGRDAGPVDPDEEQSWMLLMDNAAGERMRQEGHAGVSMFVDVVAFVRTLAKTAHAQTVGRYGFDAFDPCLLDIIWGRAEGLAALHWR